MFAHLAIATNLLLLALLPLSSEAMGKPSKAAGRSYRVNLTCVAPTSTCAVTDDLTLTENSALAEKPTLTEEAPPQPAPTQAASTKERANQGAGLADGSADSSAKKPLRKMQRLTVNENRLRFTLPTDWKKAKPRNNLIDLEFTIPSFHNVTPLPNKTATLGKDLPHGRMTMIASGGEVETILRRWTGYFRLGQDSDGKDALRRDRLSLDQAVVHTLDISGTFFEAPQGPLGPKIERPNYRLLGAIIEVEGAGRYFVKMYGPALLVAENAEAFRAMLRGLDVLSPVEEPEASTPQDANSETTYSETNRGETKRSRRRPFRRPRKSTNN